MKRQRGRGRKPGGGGGHHHNNQGGGGHHPNRTLESNGPEIKVRGPASHVYERYLQLARDAASSGDRVLSENYLQHADHYFRLVRSMQPAMPVQQHQPDRQMDGDYEGDDDVGGDGEGGDDGETRAEGGDDQPEVEFPQQQQGDRQPREGGEGEGRRRRGRRNRFRPEGEREGGVEAREERSEGEPQREPQREPRRERPPRERSDRDGDQSGPEGFSSGPKPAFLRD